MTIQQAIEKAIEGGYMKAKDYFGYIPSVVKEVHYNKPEKLHQGHNFFERTSGSFHFGSAKKYSFSISVNEIFLDPLFWQSLGKAMGWENESECPLACCGGICPIDIPMWQSQWHLFIDKLANGGTAEQFFNQKMSFSG